MKKDVISSLLALLVCLIVLYLGFAYACAELNPMKFHWAARTAFAVIILCFCAACANSIESKSEK